MIDPEQELKLSGSLASFLDEEILPDGPALAEREFYVEEELLGKRESRFVSEGGVRLVRVDSYDITVDDLEPLAARRVGIDDVQLVLLKFAFMIQQLPASRRYSTVSVRVTLRPAAPALMLRARAAPDWPRHAAAAHRTESLPVVTTVNDGLEGFGWTFEAHDGAPLHPHVEFTVAMLELPLATASLDGLFDAEAMISRRMFGTFTPRRAAPLNSAAEFSVNLPRSCPVAGNP